MKSNNKSLLVLLFALLAVAVWYFGFNSENTVSAQGNPALVTPLANPFGDPNETPVSRTLRELEDVDFDFTVLQDKVYVQLRNLSAPLLNLPVGRVNLFAPAK